LQDTSSVGVVVEEAAATETIINMDTGWPGCETSSSSEELTIEEAVTDDDETSSS
jgi:hypothetical protein